MKYICSGSGECGNQECYHHYQHDKMDNKCRKCKCTAYTVKVTECIPYEPTLEDTVEWVIQELEDK